MKKFVLFSALVWCCLSLAAQSDVTLTFTCRTEDSSYVRPDSIVVRNVDRGWSDHILYPDTVYQLVVGTDIPENVGIDGIVVSPNPFHGETTIRFALEGEEDALVEVVDLAGHTLATAAAVPNEPGIYSFRLTLSRNGVYLLFVKQAGKTAAAKLMNVGKGGRDALNLLNFTTTLEKAGASSDKAVSSYPFQLGDKMTFKGYVSGNASKEAVRHPIENDSVELVFGCPTQGDGLPCQNSPTVTDYDSNTYTTVKIGCQCWLKENLRTTHYADGTEIPMGGDAASYIDPEYWDHPECHLELQKRGYLYNWIAVMKGEPELGVVDTLVQGPCPNGWHVPKVEDWERLVSYLNEHPEYLCNGVVYQSGKALASQTGWPYSYYTCAVGHDTLANNATGFSLFSAGYCIGSAFDNSGAYVWTSSTSIYIPGFSDIAYAYNMSCNHTSLCRLANMGVWNGMSVRCLRDEEIPLE